MRPGAGIDGSDRITITWPDGAIRGQWLQVTVLPTLNTGLEEADVSYFGNAPGESGDATVDAMVNAQDMLRARNNPRSFLDPAPIDFDFDFNRDARVNATDMLIARDNQTHFLNALKLITIPDEGGKQGLATLGSEVLVSQPRVITHSSADLARRYALDCLLAEDHSSTNRTETEQAIDLLLLSK